MNKLYLLISILFFITLISSLKVNIPIPTNYTLVNTNYSLDSGKLEGRDTATLVTYIQGLFDLVYCQLTGCTMTGNLNMNLNNITNVSYVNGLNISNRAGIGDCPAGQVVMNTTTGGVQCVTLPSTDLSSYWNSSQLLNGTLVQNSTLWNNFYSKSQVDNNFSLYYLKSNPFNFINFTNLLSFSSNVNTTGNITARVITSQTTAGTSFIKLIPGWNIPSGNKGAWIDMSTDGPSGLGDGGAGTNAWIATVSSAGQWFTDSQVGDICYRRGLNRLLFGNQDEDEEDMPATLIISNNVATIKNGIYYSSDGSAGITATITTARLTPVTGSQGSMTFKNGILTAQTQAT